MRISEFFGFGHRHTRRVGMRVIAESCVSGPGARATNLFASLRATPRELHGDGVVKVRYGLFPS